MSSHLNATAESVNTLVTQLGLDTTSEDSEPFDIKDYTRTATALSDASRQLQVLAESLSQLLISPGWEQALTI